MSRPRVRIHGPLKGGTLIHLEGKEAKRLSRVLRLGVGDTVSVFDGKGGEGQGRIIEASQWRIALKVEKVWEARADSPLRIHLIQAIPKWPKMELIVQKATELGVTDIGLLITKRCTGSIGEDGKKWRLLKIIEEATRQCGRGSLPELLGPWNLEGFLELQRPSQGERILLWEGARDWGLEVLLGRCRDTVNEIWLVVGPEGGFDVQEVELLRREGFVCAWLGPRILRTETASLAALAIIQFLFGDMKGRGKELGLD